MPASRIPLAAALLAVVAAIAGPTAAVAHDQVVATTPQQGETLTAVPSEFSVTSSDDLLQLGADGAFALQITDADGYFYGDGCLTVSGPTLSTEAALGAEGDYRMAYQVISQDGHPVSGVVEFGYRPVTAVVPSPASLEPPVCGEDPVPVATAEPTPEPTPTVTVTLTPEAADGEAWSPWWTVAIGAGALVLLAIVVAIALTLARRPRA